MSKTAVTTTVWKYFANLIPIFGIYFFAYINPSYAEDYDWSTLTKGKVVVDSIKDSNGIPGVRATFIIKAKREIIWQTLVDYDNFKDIFEGIDEMKVLNNNSSGAKVEFWVDAVLKNLHYILDRKYEKPGYKITWKKISGDLKDIHGSWQIVDTEDSTAKLLVYESYVDIGFKVVTWMIQQGAMGKAEEMAYRLREWIEK